jgi:hypothetical protein
MRKHWKTLQKKGYRFPVPSPGVTKQIVPARDSLVSNIPSGGGKLVKGFLQCKMDSF